MHAIHDQGEVCGLVSFLSLESNLCQGAWGCVWLRMTSQMLFGVHLISLSHWPGLWVMGYLIWVDFASHGPKPLACVCRDVHFWSFQAFESLGVRSLGRRLHPRMWDLWAFDSGSQVVMSLHCFEEGFVLRCKLSAALGLCTGCSFSTCLGTLSSGCMMFLSYSKFCLSV